MSVIHIGSGPRWAAAGVWLVGVVWVVALAAGSAWGQEGLDPAAEAHLQKLRTGTAAERVAALEGLEALGSRAQASLERALGDPDPDVRLHALQVLNAATGKLEGRLRRIAHGRSAEPGATYPRAGQEFVRLRDTASPARRNRLIEIAARASRKRQDRLVYVALALWEACRVRDVEPRPRDAELLAELFASPLGAAADAHMDAIAALAPAERVRCLLIAIRRVPDSALARPVRAVGEVLARDQGERGREILRRYLRHREASVRVAAARAWGVLTPAKAAPGRASSDAPLVALIEDPDPAVAAEALRLIGRSRLAAGAKPAQAVALDPRRSERLRREAVRTLARIGARESVPTLKALALQRGSAELSLIAAWGWARLSGAGALEHLKARIAEAEGADQALLYAGLARLGGERALEALRGYCEIPAQVPRVQNALRSQLEGRMQRAVQAFALARPDVAVRELNAFLERPPLPVKDFPRPNAYRLAIAALGEVGTDAARTALFDEVLRNRGRSYPMWKPLYQVLRHLGPTREPSIALTRAVSRLSIAVRQGQPDARRDAAWALSRLDPTAARRTLGLLVQRESNSDIRRTYARCLGTLGDRLKAVRSALPVSQRELRSASGTERLLALNAVGIDYLYAGRFAEARLAFRRMSWTQPNYFYSAYNEACVLSKLGREDDALRLLRRAIRFGSSDVNLLRYDQDLVALHDDPRFLNLVDDLRSSRETGLPLRDSGVAALPGSERD